MYNAATSTLERLMNADGSITAGSPSDSRLPMRWLTGLLIVTAGLLLQVFFLQLWSWLIGLALVVYGSIRMMPKGASNAPVRIGKRKRRAAWEFQTPSGPKAFHKDDWAKIDKAMFDKINDLLNLSKRASTGRLTGFIWVMLPIVLFAWFGAAVITDFENIPAWMSLVFPNAAIFLTVLGIGGNVTAWVPPGLKMKLRVYTNVLPIVEQSPDLSITTQAKYYSAVEGDEKIPYDLQLKANWKDAPEELYGIQFQVSQNSVQGTAYPYYYAVIVAQSGFHLKQKLKGVKAGKPEITTYKKEKDVEIVVIRQDPDSRGTGYHTNARDQTRITANALNMFQMLKPRE